MDSKSNAMDGNPKRREGYVMVKREIHESGVIGNFPGQSWQVYEAMAQYAGARGFCTAANSTLSKAAGVSERTVRRAKEKLQNELGVIAFEGKHIHKDGTITDKYKVEHPTNLVRFFADKKSSDRFTTDNLSAMSGQSDSDARTNSQLGSDKLTDKEQGGKNKERNNNVRKTKRKFDPRQAEFPFTDDDFTTQWDRYVTYRYDNRRPITKSEYEIYKEEMIEWGVELAIKALKTTMLRGRLGIEQPAECEKLLTLNL